MNIGLARGKARTCGFWTLGCKAPEAKVYVRAGVVGEKRVMWSKLQLTAAVVKL